MYYGPLRRETRDTWGMRSRITTPTVKSTRLSNGYVAHVPPSGKSTGVYRLSPPGDVLLDRPGGQPLGGHALTWTVDRRSKVSYAQQLVCSTEVMNKIAQVRQCLAVDPNLNAETAIDLGQIELVKRALTGDHNIFSSSTDSGSWVVSVAAVVNQLDVVEASSRRGVDLRGPTLSSLGAHRFMPGELALECSRSESSPEPLPGERRAGSE